MNHHSFNRYTSSVYRYTRLRLQNLNVLSYFTLSRGALILGATTYFDETYAFGVLGLQRKRFTFILTLSLIIFLSRIGRTLYFSLVFAFAGLVQEVEDFHCRDKACETLLKHEFGGFAAYW